MELNLQDHSQSARALALLCLDHFLPFLVAAAAWQAELVVDDRLIFTIRGLQDLQGRLEGYPNLASNHQFF